MCASLSFEDYNIGPRISLKVSKSTKKAYQSIQLIRELLPMPPSKSDVEDIDLTEEISSDEQAQALNLRKFHDDLKYIEKIFISLAEELESSCSFNCLQEFLQNEKVEEKKKADFIAMFHGQKWKAKHFEKSNKIRCLQRELKSVRQDTVKQIQIKDEEIAYLTKAVEDAKRLNPKREEFEKKLAKVQIENLQFVIEQEMKDICSKNAKVGREIPQEIRVHDALMNFLKESCAKLEGRILEWENKFETDTQEKRQEVAVWQAEVQTKKTDLENLDVKYEGFRKVVMEYEAAKEIERLEKEEEDRRNRAAAKIQAWWKGWMVRRGMNAGFKKKNKKNKPVKK